MTKLGTLVVAAVALMVVGASPASAQHRGGDGFHHGGFHHGFDHRGFHHRGFHGRVFFGFGGPVAPWWRYPYYGYPYPYPYAYYYPYPYPPPPPVAW